MLWIFGLRSSLKAKTDPLGLRSAHPIQTSALRAWQGGPELLMSGPPSGLGMVLHTREGQFIHILHDEG